MAIGDVNQGGGIAVLELPTQTARGHDGPHLMPVGNRDQFEAALDDGAVVYQQDGSAIRCAWMTGGTIQPAILLEIGFGARPQTAAVYDWLRGQGGSTEATEQATLLQALGTLPVATLRHVAQQLVGVGTPENTS